MRFTIRKTWWYARRLHESYPQDGWVDAIRTGYLMYRIQTETVDIPPLTEAQLFELEVEMDIASLPTADWVI